MLVVPEARASLGSDTAEFELRAAVKALALALGLAIFAFSFANAFNTNTDDVAIMYPADGALWLHTQLTNLRFVTLGLARLLSRFIPTYYQMIGLWCALLVCSLWLLSDQLSRYIGLGLYGTAWIFAAASLHGFMAELYSFTMAYANFAIGMLGAALLLAAVRHPHQPWAFPLGTAGAFIALGSYQPFLLVPAFAVCLRLWLDNMQGDHASFRFRELALLASCVLTGAVAMLACKLVLAPILSTPRGFSLGNALTNALPYLTTIADIHLTFARPYNLIYPWHERYIYFAGTLALILLACVRFARAPRCAAPVAALGASLLMLLLIPGAFNLLGSPYWPTARSMASIVFFHAALVPSLVALLPEHDQIWRKCFFVAGLIFLAMSASSQSSLYFERYLQARADLQLAAAIVTDLRNRTEIGPTTRIAIKSSWQNPAQRPTVFMDYGLSAFSNPWSSIAILRLISSVSLRDSQIPEQGCDGHRGAYEVREIDGSWLVCLK